MLRAWQRDRTGYPVVDAGMRELWTTGMHNRGRMIVASFLVDTLVDADLANNTMGWQWSAGCGADATLYFRIFNPVSQGVRFNPDGSYVRRRLPDVTDQKALEHRLRKAQRMEAIGQLCGGISHDFSNLLTVMNGHSDLLEEQLDQRDSSFTSAKEIKKAVTHAASLTRQLLAYSRQQVLEPKVLDLNSAITGLGRMLRRLIGEDIELITALDSQLEHIKADEGQIQQVIMNLVVNACDAMPKGGKLTVETANVTVDAALAKTHAPMEPGEYVRLSVEDTGHGMDAATKARIFEPFFTTKEVGKGTGLGLSTVYGVVKQSGGYIWVESEPGCGSTFRIYLPRTTETLPLQKSGAHTPVSFRGNETILLVEDADQVRELTCNWLTSSGFTVLDAKDPEEAIRIVEQHQSEIHLLLTDVILPGLNGWLLAEKLYAMRPGLKTLYMSGYTGFLDLKDINADIIILQKPFTRNSLLGKLREVLSSEMATAPVSH